MRARASVWVKELGASPAEQVPQKGAYAAGKGAPVRPLAAPAPRANHACVADNGHCRILDMVGTSPEVGKMCVCGWAR